MQTNGDSVSLTGNDLELSIATSVPATVHEAGQVVLPAKLFIEAIRRSPSDTISLQLLDEKNSIRLTSGSMQLEMLTLAVDEFPEQPRFPGEIEFFLSQRLAKNMVKQVAFAVSTEELRPILTGAQWQVRNDELRMTALDGYRLASRWGEITYKGKSNSLVVPGKALQELARLLTDDDEELVVSIGATYVAFEFSGVRLITRLLEGAFPSIDQFIPKNYQTRTVLSTRRLWEAIERAALVTKEGTSGPVKIIIEENKMAVSAQSMDIGRHYEEWPIQKTGENLNIMYNIKALVDVLRCAEADEVVLDFHGSYGPCICRPVGQDNYFSLLMPVRLTT